MKDIRSFTLMELIVVVVAVGIVAGFAIPSYQRAIERTYAREATNNLIIIHAANYAHRSEVGQFWPIVNGQDLAAINANLTLNIIANDTTYNCDGVAPGLTFTCIANRPGSFTVTITEAAVSIGTNPTCVSATSSCPY